MDPVAFTIFGQDVMWYGIIITAAMVLSVAFIMKSAGAQGFESDDFLDIALYALPTGVIFARAYYVLFNLPMYDTFAKMIDIREGGLAIHGGLIGGILAGYIVVKIKKMNFFKAADVVAPFLALAQSIGRWGNYINQEAYGRATDLPWAITIDGVGVHPTFLYESIWDFLVFLVLLRKSKNKDFDGQLISLYMILYSLGRFFIEGLRTDSLMLGNLRAAQIASIIMVLLGALLLIMRRNKGLGMAYEGQWSGCSNYNFAKDLKSQGNKALANEESQQKMSPKLQEDELEPHHIEKPESNKDKDRK